MGDHNQFNIVTETTPKAHCHAIRIHRLHRHFDHRVNCTGSNFRFHMA